MTEVSLQQRIYIPTLAQRKFLRLILQWDGAATPQEIGPQVSQEENSTRQTCKRRGWVTFDRYYWRITDAGRKALAVPSAERANPDEQETNAELRRVMLEAFPGPSVPSAQSNTPTNEKEAS